MPEHCIFKFLITVILFTKWRSTGLQRLRWRLRIFFNLEFSRLRDKYFYAIYNKSFGYYVIIVRLPCPATLHVFGFYKITASSVSDRSTSLLSLKELIHCATTVFFYSVGACNYLNLCCIFRFSQSDGGLSGCTHVNVRTSNVVSITESPRYVFSTIHTSVALIMGPYFDMTHNWSNFESWLGICSIYSHQ